MADSVMLWTAGADHIQIGYREPFTKIEYGAFLDETAKGLGYRLVATGSLASISHRWDYDELPIMRKRTVSYGTWEPT